jgi:hypothetical protein
MEIMFNEEKINGYDIAIGNNNFNGFTLCGFKVCNNDKKDYSVMVSMILSEKKTVKNENFIINERFGKFGDKSEYVFFLDLEDHLFDYNTFEEIFKLFQDKYNLKVNEKVDTEDKNYCPF